jgi:AraC-like DNA-binding protein
MEPISLTRASIVFPIASFLQRVGAPVPRLLAEAGLPSWILTDPEALIPTSSTTRLFTRALRTAGIQDVGLRSGQQAHIEHLGNYGRLIRSSGSLGEALDEIVRDHRIFSSAGTTWLAGHGQLVRFCQAFTGNFDPFDEGWQQVNHYILMLMLHVIRLGAGERWRPTEVHLQTGASPALLEERSLSDARVAFARPATAIVLPRALLDEPLRPRRSDLEIRGDRIALWKASAPADDFVRSILQVVETLSWESYPDIHLTADVLGLSVRTLQRHLADAGVTHESLVGRARFETATDLLEETDAKVLDIALDLGYSDHAHFTRAFRRWAGCSPHEFRRRGANRRAAGHALTARAWNDDGARCKQRA